MVKVAGQITVDYRCISKVDDSNLITINGVEQCTVREIFGVPDGPVSQYDESLIALVPEQTNIMVDVKYSNYNAAMIAQIVKVIDYQITEDGWIKAFKVIVREIDSGSHVRPMTTAYIEPVISEMCVTKNAMCVMFTGDYDKIAENNCAWIKDHYGIAVHMGKVYYYQESVILRIAYRPDDNNAAVKYHKYALAALYHCNKLGTRADIEELKKIVESRLTNRPIR